MVSIMAQILLEIVQGEEKGCMNSHSISDSSQDVTSIKVQQERPARFVGLGLVRLSCPVSLSLFETFVGQYLVRLCCPVSLSLFDTYVVCPFYPTARFVGLGLVRLSCPVSLSLLDTYVVCSFYPTASFVGLGLVRLSCPVSLSLFDKYVVCSFYPTARFVGLGLVRLSCPVSFSLFDKYVVCSFYSTARFVGLGFARLSCPVSLSLYDTYVVCSFYPTARFVGQYLVRLCCPVSLSLFDTYVVCSFYPTAKFVGLGLVRLCCPVSLSLFDTALSDNGSQRSLITEKCAAKLGIPIRHKRIAIGGLEDQLVESSLGEVFIRFSSHFGHQSFETTALVLTKLTNNIPSFTVNKTNYSHMKGLILADPLFFKSREIDVILGSDIVFNLIQEGRRNGNENEPSAIHSKLGWLVYGPTSVSERQSFRNLAHFSSELESEDLIKRFWNWNLFLQKKFLQKKKRIVKVII
ncbi:hypothetical protein LAZ67_17001450 [Cordylochernes scorpioides]|uniref:Peptidase aspartic putative domain-containing protein n=1 Tax=Cordylochernes scorpioides TaxID=51811 RepID=A0ABY6LFH9_9ARAC|nr:hypothetical protein LAZ67_17001450 [Cordylochernes scorpioides]